MERRKFAERMGNIMKWFGKKEDEMLNAADREPEGMGAQTVLAVAGEKNQCYDALQEVLTRTDARAQGTVLKLYIENFKQLNAVFGYDYCEALLEQILAYLEQAAGTRVLHFIGVEYIVVLEQTTAGRAQALAQDILNRFEQAWKVGHTDCICSIQIGICAYPEHANTADGMLKCLDVAVSKAAEYGPNQSAIYDSTLHAQMVRRQTIGRYLGEALEKQEVEVRYRPTYNIETGKFVRAELYLRIFVKGLGMIGAPEFLPIAEDSGQVRALEYFALEQTGACIREMIDKGIDFESLTTRISPVMFLQEDFLDKVQDILNRYQIPVGKMGLEIMENSYTTAYLNINIMLQQLSDMGVEIILNDFGSGYSSISSILELPVDAVKLERMFIWQVENNDKAGILVDGLVRTAQNLGLKVIAEGVETQRQLDVLGQAKCLYQQGFYYAPTVEKEAMLELMNHSIDESRTLIDREREKIRR